MLGFTAVVEKLVTLCQLLCLILAYHICLACLHKKPCQQGPFTSYEKICRACAHVNALLLSVLLLSVQPQRLATYMKLARIHNLAPSITLVMVGAWVSQARNTHHGSTHCSSIAQYGNCTLQPRTRHQLVYIAE